MRVLLLDDEHSSLKLIGKALQKEGIKVDEFADIEDAKHACQDAFHGGEYYDSVLVDLFMPTEKHGKEFIHWMHGHDIHRKTKIFIISGDPAAKVDNFLRNVSVGIISKPIKKKDVIFIKESLMESV